MKVKWKKALVLVTVAALAGFQIKALADESAAESRKLSVLSVDGEEAFVTKGGQRELPAAAGMPLGQGSKVKTGYKTNLYLTADQDKTIRLSGSSQAEITKASSKKLKITLKSGAMYFNVENPLAQDEEMGFEAAQTSMSIRGTSGVIAVDGDDVTLIVLEGQVGVNEIGPGDNAQSQGGHLVGPGEAAVFRGGSIIASDIASQALEDLEVKRKQKEEADRAAQQQNPTGRPSRLDGTEPAPVSDDDDDDMVSTKPAATEPSPPEPSPPPTSGSNGFVEGLTGH